MANDLEMNAQSIALIQQFEGDSEPIYLVTGENCSVRSADSDVLAIGYRARAHSSGHLCRSIAVGSLSLAETSDSGWCPATAIGVAAMAIAYAEDETALAIGYGVEACAPGRRGTAIAVSFGDAHCIVSAGPGGRLVIVDPCLVSKHRAAFEAHIDEDTFLSGVRYTVNTTTGAWREVAPPAASAKQSNYQPSQVTTPNKDYSQSSITIDKEKTCQVL